MGMLKDTFLSPETLKEIQRRFQEDPSEPNLPVWKGGKVPHDFTVIHNKDGEIRNDMYKVYKSRWQQTEGSLREGWD